MQNALYAFYLSLNRRVGIKITYFFDLHSNIYSRISTLVRASPFRVWYFFQVTGNYVFLSQLYCTVCTIEIIFYWEL